MLKKFEKMIRKIAISLFMFLFSLFVLTSPVSAEEGEKIYVLAKDEVVNEDLIIAANKIKIYGTVNGDLYAAGGTVLIDGIVNGDVLVSGGNIEISGTVIENARVLGGDVLISGEVGKNLSVGAGNAEINDEALVGGSLVIGAGTVIIDGEILGKSNIGGGVVTVSSKLGGDAKLGAGALSLDPGAEIDGSLDYWSDSEAAISDEATISGEVNKHNPMFNPENMLSSVGKEKLSRAATTFTFTAKIIWLASTFLVGMIFINLFPKITKSAVKVLQEKPLKTIGYGAVSLFVIPIAFFFLLLTIVGAPLSFIVIALYFIYLYLAKIIISLMVGRYIVQKADLKVKDALSLGLGLAVYAALSLIPVLGGVVKFAAIIAGLGALIVVTRQSLPTFASKK